MRHPTSLVLVSVALAAALPGCALRERIAGRREPASTGLRTLLDREANRVHAQLGQVPDGRKKEGLRRAEAVLRRLVQSEGRIGDIVVSPIQTFAGETIVRTDTTYVSDRISFLHGARIRVADGATLVLLSRDVRVSGTALVDGSGADGSRGRDGPSRGVWVSQGDDDFWLAKAKCDTTPSSIGGDGSGGIAGGAGAIVVVETQPRGEGELRIQVNGGRGGDGGVAGRGAQLRNGRDPACEGCAYTCASGNAGAAGENGLDGLAVFLRSGGP